MKDSYTWQARMLPAVAFMLPCFVEINWLLRLSNVSLTWPTIVANSVIALVIVVFSNLCRYYGKKKETVLFKEWGGAPTTRFLRHSNTEYNAINREMVKSYWKARLYDIKIPSEEDERNDPDQADLKYIAFVNKLRTDTRLSKLFPLLKAENRNYGMWRNLYGIKGISVVLCIILIVINIGLSLFFPSFMSVQSCYVISGIILLILLAWIFVVTKSKVKQSAEVYAERLLEVCFSNRDQLKEELGDNK